MRRLLSLASGFVSVVALCACGGEPASGSNEGIRVEARQTVLVTDEPLGDVVDGEMKAGDTALASCYVAEAKTNTGAVGAAVKVESGGLAGYAAVTNFPDDPADRVMVFDLDDSDLRAALPACGP